MANIPVDETIEVPFDSLTNEQRDAINFVATGKGLKNPVQPILDEVFSLVETERERIAELTAQSPDGCVDGIATTECPVGCQCLIELDFLLDVLKYELDLVQIHTDKISGVGTNSTEFFERLSVAGQFTKVMKSMTGIDTERYSQVFNSLTGGADFCINRILRDCLCNPGTGCGPFSDQAGLRGVVDLLCQQPSLCSCVLGTILPAYIDCVRELIKIDDENYCEAQRVIKNYANASQLASAANSDPLLASVVEGVFATTGLKNKLQKIRDNFGEESEGVQSVAKFFPEFSDAEGGGTANCFETTPTVVPGVAGPPGPQGCRGNTGPAGPQGPCGEECGTTDATGACCVGDYCLEVTEANCAFYGGDYFGDFSHCFNGSTGVQCLPPNGCIDGGDCETGLICCNGQCTQPCPADVGGGCPPCPNCPPGVPECPSGSGNCCSPPQICCGSQCVSPCEDGSCPDCNGACCPSGTTCCGGFGCCPVGNCCNGFCCADGQSCCGNQCCPDERCCGNSCCSPGSFCCNGECLAVGSPCCGSNQYLCGGNCCDNDRDCCDGVCCNSSSATCCGGSCCSSQCCRDGNCCDPGDTCGCPNGKVLSADCGCECPGGGDVCGDFGCCAEDERCCAAEGNFCCPESDQCCGGYEIGSDGSLSSCCASGTSCCSDNDGNPVRCCYDDEICCDGQCCPSGQTCCGGNTCCEPGACCSDDDGDYCGGGVQCGLDDYCYCGETCCGGTCIGPDQYCCGGTGYDIETCIAYFAGADGGAAACCCDQGTPDARWCENGCCGGGGCAAYVCSSGSATYTRFDGTEIDITWTGACETCPDAFRDHDGDVNCNNVPEGGCGCDCPCGMGKGVAPCDCTKICPYNQGAYSPWEYAEKCQPTCQSVKLCDDGSPANWVLQCEASDYAQVCPEDIIGCVKLECVDADMGCTRCAELDYGCAAGCGDDICEMSCLSGKGSGEKGKYCEDQERPCICDALKTCADNGGCTQEEKCEIFCGCMETNQTVNINSIPCQPAGYSGGESDGIECKTAGVCMEIGPGVMRPDCTGQGPPTDDVPTGDVCGGSWDALNGPNVSNGSICDYPPCCGCNSPFGGGGKGRGNPGFTDPNIPPWDDGSPNTGYARCNTSSDCPEGFFCNISIGVCQPIDSGSCCPVPCESPNICNEDTCRCELDPLFCGGNQNRCDNLNESDFPGNYCCVNEFCVLCDDPDSCPSGFEAYNGRCVESALLGRCCSPESQCVCTEDGSPPACCLGRVLVEDCVGGIFRQGLTCADPCPCTPAPVLGVCCSNGFCVGITEQIACGGSWCELGTSCNGAPVVTEADCPVPDDGTNYCCLPAQEGQFCTEGCGQCAAGLECCPNGPEAGTCQKPGTCDSPVGNCCQPDGSCSITTQEECTTGGWTASADQNNPTCEPNPCEQPALGSCCTKKSNGTYTCVSGVFDYNCTFPNIFHENQSCTANQCDCADDNGGCCVNGECRPELGTRQLCDATPGGTWYTCQRCDCTGSCSPPSCNLCGNDDDCLPYPNTCCNELTGICEEEACDVVAPVGVCCRPDQQGCSNIQLITRNCCRRGANHPDTQAEANYCPYQDAHNDWKFGRWREVENGNEVPPCSELGCTSQETSCCDKVTRQCREVEYSIDCDPMQEIPMPCDPCTPGEIANYGGFCTDVICPCIPGSSPGCDPDPGVACYCNGTCIKGGIGCGQDAGNENCCKAFLGADCSICSGVFPDGCPFGLCAGAQEGALPPAGQLNNANEQELPSLVYDYDLGGYSVNGMTVPEQLAVAELVRNLYGKIPGRLTYQQLQEIATYPEGEKLYEVNRGWEVINSVAVGQPGSWFDVVRDASVAIYERTKARLRMEPEEHQSARQYANRYRKRLQREKVTGGQARLASNMPLVVPTQTTNISLQNIKFQIVNFDQEKKRKVTKVESFETGLTADPFAGAYSADEIDIAEPYLKREIFAQGTSEKAKPVASKSQNVPGSADPKLSGKVKQQREPQQKIALVDTQDSPSIGKDAQEVNNATKSIISGSFSTQISSTGFIEDQPIITFVSGSNIRLDTDEEASFIRIGLDAFYMDEITDVGATASVETIFEAGDILQYSTGGNSGGWFPVSASSLEAGVSSFNGSTGAVTGVSSFNGLTGAVTSSPIMPGIKYSFAASSGAIASGQTGGLLVIDMDGDGNLEYGENHVLYMDVADVNGNQCDFYLKKGMSGDFVHVVGASSGAYTITELLTDIEPLYLTGGDFYLGTAFQRAGGGTFLTGEDVYLSFHKSNNTILSIDGATGHVSGADVISGLTEDIIQKSSQSNVATFTISSKGAISTGAKTDSLHRLPYDATLTGIEVVTNNTAGFSAGVVVAGGVLGHPTVGAITGCTLGIAGATGTSNTIESGLTSASMTAGNFLYMQVYNNAAGATNAQVFATYNRR